VVLDLYARRVVGWSMSSSLDTELALQAFMMAFMRRRPPKWSSPDFVDTRICLAWPTTAV
jgi:transposase InsO family protein